LSIDKIMDLGFKSCSNIKEAIAITIAKLTREF